jgi:hypothetical protein
MVVRAYILAQQDLLFQFSFYPHIMVLSSMTSLDMERLTPTSFLKDEIQKTRESGVRDAIRGEIIELAETISAIESKFSKIKQGVRNIDAEQVIWVAGKLKTYSLQWTKLHDVRLSYCEFCDLFISLLVFFAFVRNLQNSSTDPGTVLTQSKQRLRVCMSSKSRSAYSWPLSSQAFSTRSLATERIIRDWKTTFRPT